jgi:putative hemolysin
MKLANWTAVLTVATLALAPVAYAADARLADCITMAKQVSAALDSAQPNASTDAARTQAAAGRSYCASQMYAQGVARYSRALQLLGRG